MNLHRGGEWTALITGAGGLLGRSLTDLLGASGWRVVALAHADLDITREDDVRNAIEAHRPDVVFNCAATPDVDRCEREPEMAFEVNERGPRWLARHAGRVGAEIVHVSTDYVFDGKKEGFYTQEDEPNPLSVYARSKLAGEMAVREEAERFYIIRSSWIFGAGGKNFGSRVVELARSGARLKGVTDQTSIPTYAPDLARRIEEVVALRAHGLYQVTNTGPTSWYEFARLALDKAGLSEVEILPVTRAELQQTAPRPRNSAMRCLVSEKMGLAPLRHWRDALDDFKYSLASQKQSGESSES
ncbi:MAG TPA: dTDP-4-dehydrorhamnose reductase, partial [Blastocatellia bacterium]|nr:dTDP-4-dehydrorhamnose reductase [Blastocatellia bacterium]